MHHQRTSPITHYHQSSITLWKCCIINVFWTTWLTHCYFHRCTVYSIYGCCICSNFQSRTNTPTTSSTFNTSTGSNTTGGIQDQQVLSYMLGICTTGIEETMGNMCRRTIYFCPTQSNGGTGKHHTTSNHHTSV